MKKVIVAVLSITTLTASSVMGTKSAHVANAQSPSTTGNAQVLLASEVVDDIPVPTNVLIYVQTQYQGYTVTQASKTTRGGKQVYRLRVDRTDVPTNNDGFYLLYDMDWNLLGEEKVAPQPSPPSQTPQPAQPPSQPADTTQEQAPHEQPQHETTNDQNKKHPVKPRENAR